MRIFFAHLFLHFLLKVLAASKQTAILSGPLVIDSVDTQLQFNFAGVSCLALIHCKSST